MSSMEKSFREDREEMNRKMQKFNSTVNGNKKRNESNTCVMLSFREDRQNTEKMIKKGIKS